MRTDFVFYCFEASIARFAQIQKQDYRDRARQRFSPATVGPSHPGVKRPIRHRLDRARLAGVRRVDLRDLLDRSARFFDRIKEVRKQYR